MKHTLRSLVGVAALLAAALPAHALYKVVGPDGKVTYTDRAPAGAVGKVTSLSSTGSVVADASLPLELRQSAQRYPVTLYSLAECEPCNEARQFLRVRGIPYAERLIASAEDGEALQRLSGARDAPTLTIGAQALRGFSTELWNSYLDSAGYPRESRLPASYQFPVATPLTERRSAAASAPARGQTPPATVVTPGTEPAPGGIKF
jgi:glutaredoxin